MMTAQEAADHKYPPNHSVPDPDGETGEAWTDPYGYDEMANKAFVEGAAWQAAQFASVVKSVKDTLGEWELSQ